MLFKAVIILVVACTVTGQTHNVNGRFGNEIIPIDFLFGDDQVLVTIHKPNNAPADFRETENLHIFSKRLIALRNSQDKICYVEDFNETVYEMIGRIGNAEFNNGQIGDVIEERIDLTGILPLNRRTVQLLLGPKIAIFCKNRKVYFLGGMDYGLLNPKDTYPRRVRRAARVTVVRTC